MVVWLSIDIRYIIGLRQWTTGVTVVSWLLQEFANCSFEVCTSNPLWGVKQARCGKFVSLKLLQPLLSFMSQLAVHSCAVCRLAGVLSCLEPTLRVCGSPITHAKCATKYSIFSSTQSICVLGSMRISTRG